jgi:hypothetical protein
MVEQVRQDEPILQKHPNQRNHFTLPFSKGRRGEFSLYIIAEIIEH